MGDTQIRQFRQGIGLTQEAMARRLDVTLASY